MSLSLRLTVLIVAVLNIAYFGVEFAVAQQIRSVSLLADSVDFLEDTAVNLLIFVGLTWSPRARARLGMALALILLLPALSFLWSLWGKFTVPLPPEPVELSLTGFGAMIINGACALLLGRVHKTGGSLLRAAFLSARNDVLANIAIVAAGLVTLVWPSVWPDVIVGLGIAALNLDAAREVFEAARGEHDAEP